MKKRLFRVVLIALGTIAPVFAGPRDAQWRDVDEAIEQGLPQTAIDRLASIVAEAIADQSYPEAIKAFARKIVLEANIQGNKPEEKIVRLQAALETQPPEMKPILEAILARWYWQYFQHNNWRLLQRTQTAEAPGPDIETWDLARILAEIDRHFQAALADPETLQAIPVSACDDLIEPSDVPDRYRPTLFDFLAHEALGFYQTGEQGALVAEHTFELDATATPVFAPAGEFVAWSPATSDDRSPLRRAVRLYQELLAFHEADQDRSAFYDVDLERLQFGHNAAVGEGKDDAYQKALERFAATTQRHEILSRVLATLAGHLNERGDALQARKLAQRGLEAYPHSAGADMCFNLIQQIEAKSAQLQTERVWNAPWPTLDITYRNVTAVYFRAYRMDFDRVVREDEWSLSEDELADLLRNRPVLEWNGTLPSTDDYVERTEHLPAPTTLSPGFYFIVSSHDRAFAPAANQLSVCPVWVSDLALVVQSRWDGRPNGGLVLDARSGAPIPGARIRIWQRDRNYDFQPAAPATTDQDGRFEFSNDSREVILLAEHGRQAVSCNEELYTYGSREKAEDVRQVVFFTDRALYRPGQSIHYKGIAIRSNQDAGRYTVRPDWELTVVFHDPNGKEIARATHRTNDYGSFDGVFTAPRDRLLGRMSIQVLEESGQTWINVEEYKRPKFRVELPAPAEAAKLGVPVEIVGKATAYTGAALDGARVSWRVERGVHLPYWCWWFWAPPTKAVAHGTATTAADGTFTIAFTAAPDLAVPVSNEPVFYYEVHADVTDATGETRSGERTVRAGYTALGATIGAGEWQTPDAPVVFAIETGSLDGDPQPAQGTLTIHALAQPDAVARPSLQHERVYWTDGSAPPVDPANPVSWSDGPVIDRQSFATDASGKTSVAVQLPAGIYRASLATKDRFGAEVTARSIVEVVAPAARRYGVRLPSHFAAPRWTVEAGGRFSALWGTGYDSGHALVELECNGRLLQRYWTTGRGTQALIAQDVTEKMRGGFTVRVTYVRENRAYVHERVVDVPWSNRQLDVKWGSFRSKLTPGEPETWTATVTGPEAGRATVEMVATLYDSALDQYLPHPWPRGFDVFRREYSAMRTEFQNRNLDFWSVSNNWQAPSRSVGWNYRTLPEAIVGDLWGYAFGNLASRQAAMLPSPPAAAAGGNEETVVLSPFEVTTEADTGYAAVTTLAGNRIQSVLNDTAGPVSALAPAAPPPDLGQVSARRNLNETAFFFPQLRSGADGEVKLEFTMPEALTEWKFIGFAHDQDLRSGFLTDKVVTAKDLMVEPNPPRFLREGDTIEFTVKVTNQTDTPQNGSVRLTFADAATLESKDDALGNEATERAFDVPARQSRTYSWRIAVPDETGFLTYKAVGATATLSDGEEGFLPVLSRRILVRESLPLPMRGQGTRAFEFTKLLHSGESSTLRHESLTVQMASQPAWYAVMALPYLMEYPYECSEQVFNRLYADALARHVANSDPKIRRIFERWKATPALDSPLEKNQDLKAAMLEETPWLREARQEDEARHKVGELFDASRLDDETARLLRVLSDRQLNDGRWSWFPGGRPSDFITLYITTGFGRLRHLGADIDVTPARKALAALDAWMTERHDEIRRAPNPDDYVPKHLDAIYLYGRSFFLADQKIADEHAAAVQFFLRQGRKFWLQTDCRMCQAQLALALQRFGDQDTPRAIMRSLRERSVHNDELGMFWRDQELSWWWYRAPIETQATMIEAFAEVANDAAAVEDCKVWLLKQKQTQDWKTTKATADAVYALLLRGEKLLASDALVAVALGDETIRPETVEAGTGFYEQRFVRGEIAPAMGRITVTKSDDGVSWGSVHWQYLEDLTKITPPEGAPLRLKKTLFVKENTARGPVLKPVAGPLAVGDELVVRIELRSDRDMEYVHLKDERGSGTEPVNVLSRYRYQDGLAYYESTRDTASHFFIDYLPKGTYVFEYSTRVQHKGTYPSGIAEVQCMYAPEFTSHSESIGLEVR